MDTPCKDVLPGLRWLGRWAGSLAGGGMLCLAVACQAAGTGPRAQDIRSITLERDCMGCPDASVIEFHRDGTATLTMKGHARFGTVDRRLQARMRAGDFDALARLAVTQGVFGWDETYEPPGIVDGAWAQLSVRTQALDKRVFSRDGAGPVGLQAVTAAVDALRGGLRFEPVP